jgi:hypothetical protein
MLHKGGYAEHKFDPHCLLCLQIIRLVPGTFRPLREKCAHPCGIPQESVRYSSKAATVKISPKIIDRLQSSSNS